MEKQANQNPTRNNIPRASESKDSSVKKNSFFDNYKLNVLSKTEKQLTTYKDMSGSRIWFDRWIMTVLDYAGWIIIAFFVYIWWSTRGQTTILNEELCKTLLSGNLSSSMNLPELNVSLTRWS